MDFFPLPWRFLHIARCLFSQIKPFPIRINHHFLHQGGKKQNVFIIGICFRHRDASCWGGTNCRCVLYQCSRLAKMENFFYFISPDHTRRCFFNWKRGIFFAFSHYLVCLFLFFNLVCPFLFFKLPPSPVGAKQSSIINFLNKSQLRVYLIRHFRICAAIFCFFYSIFSFLFFLLFSSCVKCNAIGEREQRGRKKIKPLAVANRRGEINKFL